MLDRTTRSSPNEKPMDEQALQSQEGPVQRGGPLAAGLQEL